MQKKSGFKPLMTSGQSLFPTTMQSGGLLVQPIEANPHVQLVSKRKLNKVRPGGYGVHVLRVPHYHFLLWQRLAEEMREKVLAHSRDGANSREFFDANEDLVFTTQASGSNEEIISSLVYWAQHYHLSAINVVRTLINLLMMTERKGSNSAYRGRVIAKFSTIRSQMVKLMDIPISSRMVDFLIDQSMMLASHTENAGWNITIPYWLPVLDNYVGDRVGPTDSAHGVATKARLPFLMDIMELGNGTTPIAAQAGYAAYPPSGSNGSLMQYLYSEFQAAIDYHQAQFQHNTDRKRNVINGNSALLKLFVDEFKIVDGQMLDFTEFANYLRKKARVVNRADYFSKMGGYASSFTPIPASMRNTTGTYVPQSSIACLPASEATANYFVDFDSMIRGFLANVTYGQLSNDSNEISTSHLFPYAAICLNTVDTDTFKETGKIPELVGTSAFRTNTTYLHLRSSEGALADSASLPADYSNVSGFKHKIGLFQKMFGGEKIFEATPGAFQNELKDLSGLATMSTVAVDRGMLQPFWLISPVKDVNDPLFWGDFPLISAEDCVVPGTLDYFLASQSLFDIDVAAGAFASSGTDTYPSALIEATDALAPAGLISVVKDIVGPFIGDSIDWLPDQHFARRFLVRFFEAPESGVPMHTSYPVIPYHGGKMDLGSVDSRLIAASSSAGIAFNLANESVSLTPASFAQNANGTIQFTPEQLFLLFVLERISFFEGKSVLYNVDSPYLLTAGLPRPLESGSLTPESIIAKLSDYPSISPESITKSILQFVEAKVVDAEVDMKVFGKRDFNKSTPYSGRSKPSMRRPRRKKRSGSWKSKKSWDEKPIGDTKPGFEKDDIAKTFKTGKDKDELDLGKTEDESK